MHKLIASAKPNSILVRIVSSALSSRQYLHVFMQPLDKNTNLNDRFITCGRECRELDERDVENIRRRYNEYNHHERDDIQVAIILVKRNYNDMISYRRGQIDAIFGELYNEIPTYKDCQIGDILLGIKTIADSNPQQIVHLIRTQFGLKP